MKNWFGWDLLVDGGGYGVDGCVYVAGDGGTEKMLYLQRRLYVCRRSEVF